MDSRSKTILIVDDSESVRRSVRAVLESQPEWRVCGEAVDGLDAIDKARELRPDLIILDVAMPRMNGLEAASVLRRTMPHLRILLFTMHGDVLGPSPNSTLGFDAALSKPEGIGKLVPCIQTLMGSSEQEVPEPVEKPSFEPDYGGPCRARHCTNSAKFQAEWKHVTKLVCDQHKKLVEKKPWSEVAHLFGRTPFSD
jgi:DNA-binding NarL/FixJ family response regulator